MLSGLVFAGMLFGTTFARKDQDLKNLRLTVLFSTFTAFAHKYARLK